MPLNLFYTMVQKSQKWPKTQIKGGSCLKTGSYKLIFVLSRASKQNDVDIWGPQNKKKFSYGVEFCSSFLSISA